YLEIVDILADVCLDLKEKHGLIVEQLDVGGGVGIAYTEADKPLSLYEWTQAIAAEVEKCFKDRSLALPQLLVEPGRSIVGPAGVTLYRAGHVKDFANGNRYVALDGGMADNPRPATYNAIYTARIANRMDARLDCSRSRSAKTALVGRYCESGDIIVRDAGIPAETGDTIVVFRTGAYNYSMASNYNRTARPACILIKDGT